MKSEILTWRNNFESHLASIKIEFDSFFLNQEVSDFYALEEDAGSSGLILQIVSDAEVPKQIEEALIRAFADSKPS